MLTHEGTCSHSGERFSFTCGRGHFDVGTRIKGCRSSKVAKCQECSGRGVVVSIALSGGKFIFRPRTRDEPVGACGLT